MKTYKDLLLRLTELSNKELESDIKILCDGSLTEQKIDLVLNDDPLFLFRDVNMEYYCDFESDEDSKDYDCEKLLESNYPIIRLI